MRPAFAGGIDAHVVSRMHFDLDLCLCPTGLLFNCTSALVLEYVNTCMLFYLNISG